MSAFVKGLKKPKTCDCCPINLPYAAELGCGFDLEHCPIVDVSKHGRLIDQDEYRDEFMNGVYVLCSDDSDNYRANAIVDLFDEAPTVVEAEGVET